MRTGVWLVGARGSVATTSIVGALALRAGLTGPTGCVTELPGVRGPALPAFADLVFGGHDVVTTPLAKRAEALADAGVLPARLVAALTEELATVERELRPAPTGGSQADRAAALVRDLTEFRDRHRLARVVVVNVAATEPACQPHPGHADPDALHAALTGPDEVLPPSSLYGYAAVTAGCSYVDFTPSTGLRLPALVALAEAHQVPYAGHDGKTGETLLKSVLAPMFAMRNLQVRSWSGTNLLGGGDGATLADPAANAAKVRSKQRVLGETLGYLPQGDTRIDYVESLGDFKTAWDLITFAGFLGTGMRLEFTWHGCDSALAAPLVLDLARLTAAAHAAGHTGPLADLAFFFKDPLDADTHSLAEQWTRLCAFAQRLDPGGTDDRHG
ncbi:inositol-3-phosphate synthase [Micromonospora endophytica]|uniref:Myo-inositol-1-phosphate synthase n=1 Tax=Micromonospora endophytica TaxID=515350 RepID=A0A2W2CL79_9ACTN|nr:inositol-3-phosphate synthase [Micromonospora endophytica]PZG00252.1 myo-inositol-1-phosphate synthase [Micromonospora endophytica]RIW47376.1 myo-inositol-1-phosphate synthase [Micromonospora endophytica]BCJ60861.1 myo-inositol-1-phosphate synthase [Micromonospora endophytica]